MLKKRKSPVSKGFVISIDGPSGAGKSSVSRNLAIALEGRLMDTGAMYRSVAYFSVKKKVDDEEAVAQIARALKFSVDPKTQVLLVNDKDLGQKIRTQKIGAMASKVSQFKKVRALLTSKQRRLGKQLSRKFPVVVEGRDIGTIVFPKVDFKFFVTADPKVRAERRYHQLKAHGNTKITLKEILKQNAARDRADSSRKLAPLKCAEDAIVVDTSHMGMTQVVNFMCDHINGKRKLL